MWLPCKVGEVVLVRIAGGSAGFSATQGAPADKSVSSNLSGCGAASSEKERHHNLFMNCHRRPARLIFMAVASAVAMAGCDGSGCGFEPKPGLSGVVSLQSQSDLSGALVRIVALDSLAVTDSAGLFSFADIPDGRWLVEASYPYFSTDAAEVEVRDGLQRNAVRFSLRQLLKFRVEIPDSLVSFCRCERSFEFIVKGYAENVTGDDVTIACGSTPLTDFAIVSESGDLIGPMSGLTGRGRGRLVMPVNAVRRSSPCAAGRVSSSGGPAGLGRALDAYIPCDIYGMILPGELDMPGTLTLGPSETRTFELSVRLLSECFEDGRFKVFWALVDCFNHPEHYVYDEPGLNRTLLTKRGLLVPASVRLIGSSSN